MIRSTVNGLYESTKLIRRQTDVAYPNSQYQLIRTARDNEREPSKEKTFRWLVGSFDQKSHIYRQTSEERNSEAS